MQAEIVKWLRPDGTGVTVVGDDAQAIYSFRGATVQNILHFPNHFPNANVIKLEQNYRSTDTILTLANAVISQQSEGFAKKLWSSKTSQELPYLVTCSDEFTEAAFVAQSILNQREIGVTFQQQAVLFRASHHSILLEAELLKLRIPFLKRGGITFTQAAHVKDVMAFLKFIENPLDLIAGTRLLCLLPGIGPKKSREYIDHLNNQNGDFGEWLSLTVPQSARLYWEPLVSLMSKLSSPQAPELAAQIGQILSFYAPLLERQYADHQERLLDLRQVESLASQYSCRSTFLSEIALDPPSSTQDFAQKSDDDDDKLVLSTIHSAKGLEWETVYIIHASDGNIPSSKALGTSREIDEELRLFFVALTRARDHLYVTFPLRSASQSARGGITKLTRFLPEDLWPLLHQTNFGHPPPLNRPPIIQPSSEMWRLRSNVRQFWDNPNQ